MLKTDEFDQCPVFHVEQHRNGLLRVVLDAFFDLMREVLCDAPIKNIKRISKKTGGCFCRPKRQHNSPFGKGFVYDVLEAGKCHCERTQVKRGNPKK